LEQAHGLHFPSETGDHEGLRAPHRATGTQTAERTVEVHPAVTGSDYCCWVDSAGELLGEPPYGGADGSYGIGGVGGS
jgi:hypothetical protein